jgi:hypothetical protein
MHKIVKHWLIVGTVEAVGIIVLIFTAPKVINEGRPMLGFAMFGSAIALSFGSTSYVSFRLGMATKAKHKLIQHYPQYSEIPLTSFLEISPLNVDKAIALLDTLGDQQELIDSANIIAFIKETSDYE